MIIELYNLGFIKYFCEKFSVLCLRIVNFNLCVLTFFIQIQYITG